MHDVNELLAKSLSEIRRLKAVNHKLEHGSREPIAIVGAACRYPGNVASLDELWQFLRDGRDGVTSMTDQRWPMARYLSDDPNQPGTIYSDAMGLLDGIDRFDAALFGLKAEETRHIDPQHRLLMELTWETIEDAGYAVESLTGSRTGVYVGIMNDDYGQLQGPLENASFYIGSGIARSCAAGRLAFSFGLEGPAIALDSACSSSLVGTHLAVQALRRGECDAAIAGGVNLVLSPQGSVVICRSHMLSRRGHCHAFDHRADGYVRSEGGGLVMLKRLSDAERDGDRIYAVIRGSAVNHDGRSQGLTAPSGRAQRQVIAAALADAGVAASEVRFIECHGTGTALGDPIEFRAISASYVQPCPTREPLILGAVKTNFGHMESAAGIGGLHKAIQVVRHKQVPKNLHFEAINPQITLDQQAVHIPIETVDLVADGAVLAAVSSFGFSGTNAHVIVQGYTPADDVDIAAPSPRLFKLSAHTGAALIAYAQRYIDWIDSGVAPQIDSLCRTAAVARSDSGYRIACTVNDLDDLRASLLEYVDVVSGDQEQQPVTAFQSLWTIDGAAHSDWSLAVGLYQRYSCYRDTVMEAVARLQQRGTEDAESFLALWREQASSEHTTPVLAQAVHRLAIARVLMHVGLLPTQVTGSGYGEFVAGAVAGVLSTGELVDILLDARVPEGWRPQRPRFALVSSVADTEFQADIWRDRTLQCTADAAPDWRPVLTAFVRKGRCEQRYGHLCIGERLRLTLGAALQPAVFHWVHGDINRDRARGLEAIIAQYYMAGAPVQWTHVHQDCRHAKCSLPTYPFQRERHWTDWGYSFDASLPSTVGRAAGTGSRSPVSTLPATVVGAQERIDHRLLYAVARCPSGAQNFHGEISLSKMPSLAAHRVFGETMVPASLYIDLIATVSRRIWPDDSVHIEELRLQHKCVLDQNPLPLYCHVRPDEGVVEIFTRTSAEAEWRKHARARVSHAARTAAIQQDIGDYRSACPEAVPVRAHYHALDVSGLNYGPDFQGIFELWRGQDCALAKIGLPPGVDQDLAGYSVHPILMDACLQAISAAVSFEDSDDLFVPATVRGVRCHKPLPERLWCFLRIMPATDAPSAHAGAPVSKRREPYCAALTLMDMQGEVVLTIDRFETMLFTAPAAEAVDTGDYADWLYEKQWRIDDRLSATRVSLPALSHFRDAVRMQVSDQTLEDSFAAYLDTRQASDRLAAAYILEALDTLGIPRQSRLSPQLMLDHGVLAQHARLCKRLLGILCDAGCARTDTDGGVVLTEAAQHLPSSSMLEHHTPAVSPQLADQLDFFVRFGRELTALLTGRRDPLGLLFANDHEAQTEGVYQEAEGAVRLNQILAAVSAHACAHLTPPRKIRILEVGAGTGATTAHVLPRLEGFDIEYVFTDISQHFLHRAKEKFDNHPGMTYALLDIAADPTTQPLPGSSFDIVIAVNVLHATPDIRRTLGHLNHYLRAGGLLVFKELTEPQSWVDMTFGFTEGWWSFTDQDLRRDGPLLDANQWTQVLAETGFESAVANARDTDPVALRRIPEAVIYARKQRSAQGGAHWLLFSNQDAESDEIETQLKARGDRVTVVCRDAPLHADRLRIDPGDAAAFESAFVSASARHGTIDGALYAWSLQASDPLSRALMPALEVYARHPLSLCQTVLQTQWRDVTLTFLTRGAQPVVHGRVDQPLAALVWGHVGCFVNENGLYARLIDLDPDATDLHRTTGDVLDLLHDRSETQLGLRQDGCYINRLQPTTLSARTAVGIREDASYLITGGFGALGLETALELARQGARHIILVGRDASKGQGNPLIERIHATGARTCFVQADVSDEHQLTARLSEALASLPPLRGVIHSVGVLADGVIAQQRWEQYLKVFAPKVLGTLHLHRATLNCPLDFFILYSSAAAILGNPGQANHAAANTFMDSFAWYRRSQSRPGLSINWGGWSQIGAAAGHADSHLGRADSLIGFIPPEQGIAVIARQFASEHAQFSVIPIRTQVAVDAEKMPYLQKLLEDILKPVSPASEPTQEGKAESGDMLLRLRRAPVAQRSVLTRQYLVAVIGALLGSAAVGSHQASLFDMGLDSLLSIDLRLRLEKELGCRLPSTLLHDNPTIDSLTSFLLDSIVGRAAPVAATGTADAPAVVQPMRSVQVQKSAPDHAPAADTIDAGPAMRATVRQSPVNAAALDIAIIGIAGRFPGAGDVDMLWDNLLHGRDSITTIPEDRWDHRDYFDARKDAPGKSYCAWGGFIEGVDQFDPLFFNISPRMAAFIDPNERLFLETAWNLLEEAGHTREILRQHYDRRVGVFVGAMYQLYPSFAGDAMEDAATALSSYNAIANRVSYFFDLRGPSVAIDTMCSSSLTAIDAACQSLIGGGCRLAIAGGVNLSLHPKKYVGLSQAQIVGSRPESRGFSDGDGFLPAETVGAVLLKPLAQALADGDSILAVIKSTLTNHGGHSTGYFAPNAEAQVQLVRDNFAKAGIAPDTIAYVEAAANGASLGDAVEFRALSEVFAPSAAAERRLPIGAVKLNIGHPEAASGIAQLAKVVMQLRHRQLVPSIDLPSINPGIDIQGSPFSFVDTARPWQRLRHEGRDIPLRATISSFGAGGANAHLIVEEHPVEEHRVEEHRVEEIGAQAHRAPSTAADGLNHAASTMEIVVLSARTPAQLVAVAQRLLTRLRTRDASASGRIDAGTFTLANIAHTLQVHREAMDYRVAMLVDDLDALASALDHYVTTGGETHGAPVPMFAGNLRDNPSVRELLSGRAGEAMVQVFIAEGSLDKLALHWVQGGQLPWRGLRGDGDVRCIVLPTYPFERSRYWLNGGGAPPSGDHPPGRGRHPAVTGDAAAPASATVPVGATVATVEAQLAALLTEALQLRPGEIDRHQPLTHYGFDSLLTMRLLRAIEARLGVAITGRDLMDCPTLALLAERIAKSQAPQATLAGDEGPISGSDERDDDAGRIETHVLRCALSEGQAGLWLLEGMGSTQGGYNVPVVIRLDGPLDREAFDRACASVIDLHPILKTRIHHEDGVPVQTVPPGHDAEVAEVRYASAPAEADVASQLGEWARRPFQIDAGPLARFEVLSTGEARHFLLITVHHLIFDGTSAMVLVDALLDAYAGHLSGTAASQAASPSRQVHYHDYVRAEQRLLSSRRGQAHRDYWQQQLAGDLPAVIPPADIHATQAQRRGSTFARTAPLNVTDALRAFVAADAIRPSAIFLAAFKLFLRMCTGETDVTVGMPVAMRHGQAHDQAIGYFVNMVAVRDRLHEGQRFRDLVRSVQYTLMDALDHAELPFPALVKALRIERHGTASPVFQTFFAYQNFVQAHARSRTTDTIERPFRCEVLDLVSQEGEYDFGVQVFETVEGQFRLEIKFNPDCYSMAGIERMMDQWLRLIERGLAAPDDDIAQLCLADQEETDRLLGRWNDTRVEYPRDSGIASLFSQQAARHPERVALVAGDQQMTYAQLDDRSTRLARHLAAMGVRRETLVGICMHRSIDMVVGLLGILKAGGAYVPLDPAYPEARLTMMLEDARIPLVLTEQAFAGTAYLHNVRTLALDAPSFDASLDASDHLALPEPVASANQLAYVMYTSGSTGTPKGVLVEQGSVVRLVIDNPGVPLSDASVVAHLSSISFDASTFEVWGPLLNGARMVLFPDTIIDPFKLGNMFEAHGVTLAWMTARLFDHFILVWNRPLPRLQRLLIGGEVVSPQSVQLAYARHPGLCVSNGYGPTENTTFSTCYPVPRDGDGRSALPIGRPIGNSTVYVLDEQRRLLTIGSVGELYVGGDGVARGYLNRPALTAERFFADPYSDRPGARLYRTGDRVRWTADGQLEFLGRNDQQVKIRGFRIEPGEIQARLLEHAAVREAVVIAREDSPGDKRLVAYVVVDESDEQDEATGDLAGRLRSSLSRNLPDYMVPAAYVRLSALPLTPNGKLDRKALPAPEGEAYARRGFEAPQGEIEQTLAQLWSDLLGIGQVSRHDNFFELGGHSLLAARLLSRLPASLGVELPLVTVFAHPTLAGLAQAAGDALAHGGAQALLPMAPVSRDQQLPLSFAQQRLWFLAQLEGGSAAYHIPLALHLQGAMDVQAWRRSLDRLVARHEALRTVFVSVDGQPHVELLSPQIGMPFLEHDLHDAADARDQLQRLCLEEAHAPFDLVRGPLVRARLIRLGEHEHVFLLTQHHIVSDGWSMGVLVAELSALYAAFQHGQPDPLAPLSIQYPDYAAWQRQWLSGERLQTQIDFWRRNLANAPVRIELPTDRPRPAQQSFAGAFMPVQLDRELTQGLKHLSRQHGTTLFMTVLAAWSALLSRLSGQEDLVIGTPTANRVRQEIEPLIGFFVNTLALRVDLSGQPSGRDLLAQVRRTALAAQAHQDLPFEQVVEIASPPRRLDHTPLFQVMFAWQNHQQGEFELPGLQVQPAGAPVDVAKFDLELHLAETGDGTIAGALTYATALFDAETIERHREYLIALLRGLAADAERPVGAIELLGQTERTLLLETWNRTTAPYPAEACVHALFEQQVQRTPDAVALVCQDRSLTYAELNAQANRLAHRLIELGVGPDTRVAICMERSLSMVVGLLAVLKAGGAYLPLDPNYPAERLHDLLDDCAPVLLLADEGGRKVLGEDATARVHTLPFDCLPALAVGDAIDNPAVPGLTSAHLAYVIYTSGSTGAPKGVLVEHRHLVNLVAWHIHRFDLRPGCRSAATAGIAFDASVWEIWPSLCSGATLLLPPEHVSGDPVAMLQWWHAQSLDVTFLTTPLAGIAISDGLVNPGLRHLLIGGDRLQSLPSGLPEGLELINNYGPTETAVVATSGRALTKDNVVTIGRPIANTRIYLLDAHGQPVPRGAVGELYIGGDGVARGYLNRPELTAERFLDDPFSDVAGARMYRTGDLARYLPDGNLEFLGRNDQQVKIRGFRIEPGEIQARLLEHAAVREAVVIAREDSPGDKRLVAYVVVDESVEQDEATGDLAGRLRSSLSRSLPDYMVPAAYVRLTALPLTPNGKLDRKALPPPDQQAYFLREYVAPGTPLEAQLAEIWAELLQVERIGIHDNFFELGGHSLLATRVVARLRQTLQIDLPVRAVFEASTIHDLSRRLENAPSAQSSLMTLRSNPGAKDAIFFMPTVMGLGMHYSALAQLIESDAAIYSCVLPGVADDAAPLTTVEEIARYCVALLPQGHARITLAGWSFGGLLAYEAARQLTEQGRPVFRLILIDSYASTDMKLDDPAALRDFVAHIGGADRIEAHPHDALSPDAHSILQTLRMQDQAAREDGFDFASLLPVFRTNLQAMARYRPLKHSGPTLEIRAQDSLQTISDTQLLPLEDSSIVVLPGGHFDLLEGESLSRVAACML
jgi:amino acid adenylation domain-containing protein